MIDNNGPTIKKTDWYNDFYSKKQLLGNYFWYEGVLELFAYHQIDLKKMHLLEIGCGAGEFLNKLTNCNHRKGLDISKTALKIAIKNHHNSEFLQGQSEYIPFRESTFDIVVCCEVIEHVGDITHTIREMKRVLKPGGLLFLSFPNYYNPFYLTVRLLSQILNKPKWISLQIVDRFLFYNQVLELFVREGFSYKASKGKCYAHNKIPLIRNINKIESLLDSLKLQWLSFHPVIYFTNTKSE